MKENSDLLLKTKSMVHFTSSISFIFTFISRIVQHLEDYAFYIKEYKFTPNNSLTDRTTFSSERVITRMAIKPAVSIAMIVFCRLSSKA